MSANNITGHGLHYAYNKLLRQMCSQLIKGSLTFYYSNMIIQTPISYRYEYIKWMWLCMCAIGIICVISWMQWLYQIGWSNEYCSLYFYRNSKGLAKGWCEKEQIFVVGLNSYFKKNTGQIRSIQVNSKGKKFNGRSEQRVNATKIQIVAWSQCCHFVVSANNMFYQTHAMSLSLFQQS